MKRLLLLLFVLSGAAVAQIGNTTMLVFPGAPSGACTTLQLGLNASNGALYSCNNGSWAAQGGGTGTVTSFSAGTLSPLFTTSVATATTTPALSFSLSTAGANTVLGNATGSTAAPSFGQIVNGQIANSTIDLTAKVTGVLPAANGGVTTQAQGVQLFSLGHGYVPAGVPTASTISRATTVIAGIKIVVLTPTQVRFASLTLGTAQTGNTVTAALINSSLAVVQQWKFSVGSGSGNITVDAGSYTTLSPGVYYFAWSETFASVHATISEVGVGLDAGAAAATLNANANHGLVIFTQTTSSGVITGPMTVSSDLTATEHVPVVMFN